MMFDGTGVARETVEEYGWKRPHRELTRLAKEHAAHDREEARWILAAHRACTHRRLGFASFAEYLNRLFGWSARLAQEKVRVAEALERLPQLAESLEAGRLTWSHVRELTRVATRETEAAWIGASKDRAAREIEQMVSGRAPGDRPTDRARSELKKHTIRAEVTPETYALWREAVMAIQKEAGGSITEDQAIRMMARAVLGGPADEGRADYQIVVSRCPDCERITQRGRGEEVEVGAEVLEAAECDAQRIDLRERSEGAPRATQEIPPATRRLVVHRDHGRCAAPGCTNASFLDLHHVHLRSEGSTHDPDLLVTLCGAHHGQAHAGRLLIQGSASKGFTFHHADATPYGGGVHAEAAGIMTEAFDALIALDFKQGEARRALDEVRAAHVGGGRPIATAQDAVLRALRIMRHA